MLAIWGIIWLLTVVLGYPLLSDLAKNYPEEIQGILTSMVTGTKLLYRIAPLVFLFFLLTRHVLAGLFDNLYELIYKAIEYLSILTRTLRNVRLPMMSCFESLDLRRYFGWATTVWYIISFCQSIYWSFYDVEIARSYMVCVLVSGFLFLPTFRGHLEHCHFYWIVGCFNSMFYAIAICLFSLLLAWNTVAVIFILQAFNLVLAWALILTECYRGRPRFMNVNGEVRGRLHIDESLYRRIFTIVSSLRRRLRRVISPIHMFQRLANRRGLQFRSHALITMFGQVHRYWLSLLLMLIHGGLICFFLFYELSMHESLRAEIYIFCTIYYALTSPQILFFLSCIDVPVFYWLIQDMETFMWLNGIALYFFVDFWIASKVMFAFRVFVSVFDHALISCNPSAH